MRVPAPTFALAAALCALTPVAHAQCQTSKVLAGDGSAGSEFGNDVAIDGNHMVVGAPLEGSAGFGAGAVYVFERQNGTWVQTQKLTASDAAVFSGFGQSVDIEGDTLVVGSPSRDGITAFSGAVYVFDRNVTTGVWSESTKLFASDGAGFDEFGESVALSGTSLVVGAPSADVVAMNSGAAYVFRNNAGVWSQKQKLAASDGQSNDNFGWSVAIEGATLMLGANQTVAGGAVYVFDRIVSTWTQVQKFAASDLAALDDFGHSISMSGTRAVVGAPADQDLGINTGSAYVFDYDGSTWNESAKLLASDAATRNRFGTDVRVDGSTIVIGSPGDFALFGLGTNQGKAYSFVKIAAGWIQTSMMQAQDKGADDFFAWHIDLDGDRAAIAGQWNDDLGPDSGSSYVFKIDTSVSLFGCSDVLSLAAGGTQNLKLQPPSAFASKLYLLVGSVSGTSPGFSFGGFNVPLNPDAYLLFTANNPSVPPLGNSFGQLSGSATANATFTLGAGTDPSLAGLVVNHAFAVLDPLTSAFLFVSNAESCELVP